MKVSFHSANSAEVTKVDTNMAKKSCKTPRWNIHSDQHFTNSLYILEQQLARAKANIEKAESDGTMQPSEASLYEKHIEVTKEIIDNYIESINGAIAIVAKKQTDLFETINTLRTEIIKRGGQWTVSG